MLPEWALHWRTARGGSGVGSARAVAQSEAKNSAFSMVISSWASSTIVGVIDARFWYSVRFLDDEGVFGGILDYPCSFDP